MVAIRSCRRRVLFVCFVVYQLLTDGRCSLCVAGVCLVCCALLAVCCLMLMIVNLSVVVRCSLFDAFCLWYVVVSCYCLLLLVVRRLLCCLLCVRYVVFVVCCLCVGVDRRCA